MEKQCGANNMTIGQPAAQILRFMLPLVVGNALQQFYSMADAFLVGRAIGVQALAAVGATHGITFLILGFANGLTLGVSIVTAQLFGKRDGPGVRKSFATCLLICGVAAVFITGLALGISPFLPAALQVPSEIVPLMMRYLLVVFGGIPATMAYNVLASCLRPSVIAGHPCCFYLLPAC